MPSASLWSRDLLSVGLLEPVPGGSGVSSGTTTEVLWDRRLLGITVTQGWWQGKRIPCPLSETYAGGPSLGTEIGAGEGSKMRHRELRAMESLVTVQVSGAPAGPSWGGAGKAGSCPLWKLAEQGLA